MSVSQKGVTDETVGSRFFIKYLYTVNYTKAVKQLVTAFYAKSPLGVFCDTKKINHGIR